MPHPLDKFVEELEKHTRYNTAFLAGIYQALQEQTAEQTPGDWEPRTVDLHAPDLVPIVSRNMRRSSVSITNNGPSPLMLTNRLVNVSDLLSHYMAGNYGEVIPALFIASGQDVDINTTGVIYGFSVNYGTGANENCELAIVESLFKGWQGAPQHIINPMGRAGDEVKDVDKLAVEFVK